MLLTDDVYCLIQIKRCHGELQMSLRKIIYAGALSAVLTYGTSHVLAQVAPQYPYLSISEANKTSPLLGTTTSEKSLTTNFGAKNVKHQTVHVAEGETADGTVIYPNDAKRRVSFIWKDAKKRDVVEVIRLEDKPSLWHLPNQITTGTTLVQLEKLNGKPFKLSGFDWDYGGNVLSWNGGKLESLLKSKSGKFSATLSLAPLGTNTPEELIGDREILSSNAKMRKLNPVVAVVNILAP